jgi:hypothetical protein
MKTALISLEETELTTLEMIAEEGRKAGASENDTQSLKMFIPARPRPLLAARYAGPPLVHAPISEAQSGDLKETPNFGSLLASCETSKPKSLLGLIFLKRCARTS